MQKSFFSLEGRLGHTNSPPPGEQVTVFWKESVPMGETSQGRCSLSLFKGFCCALRSSRLLHATRGSRKFPHSSLLWDLFCKYLFPLKLVNTKQKIALKHIYFRHILCNNLTYSILIEITPYKTYDTSSNTAGPFVLEATLNNRTVETHGNTWKVFGSSLSKCFILFHKTSQQQSWKQNLDLLVSMFNPPTGPMPPVWYSAMMTMTWASCLWY